MFQDAFIKAIIFVGERMKKRLGIIISICFILIHTTIVFAGEWIKTGDNWQYKDDNGTLVVSSWKTIKVGLVYSMYYFDENGYMCTGLKKIDNDIYAFNENGTPKSNSSIVIDDEEYETKTKGLVEGIPLNIDIESYNARILAERKAKEESKAQAEAEAKRIQESIANRTPEELALIAASEAAEIAKEESIAAAEEAARIERYNNTIRISRKIQSSVTVKGEDGGKVTVSLLIPVLEGGNAEAINQVLADKIKKEVYLIYEEKAGNTRSKLSYKSKDVILTHDLDKNLLTLRYVNADRWNMFTLYMDTVSLNMWSDY